MKQFKSRSVILAVVLLLVLTVVFGSAFYSARKNRQYHIIYIPKIIDQTNDFWTSLIAGAKMGAQEYNAELELVAGNSENDYARQNELIEWAIRKKPDAILVSPCSFTQNTSTLKKVKENGIKLVLIDSVIDEPHADLVVATDNVAAGVKLGEYAASLIEEDAKIGVIGHVQGTSTAIDREAGVRAGLGSKAKGIQKVVFCDSGFDKAYILAQEMIADYPDIDCIFGLNEYAAVGAARAIEASGLKGQIKMVGFDSSIQEIQLMEAGVFQGIVIQKPFNMGYLGLEQTIKLLAGDKVKENLDSGSKLITLENLYTEENQKLLFPFVD